MAGVIVRWLRSGMPDTEWVDSGVPDRGDTVMLGGYRWKVVHRQWMDRQIVEMTVQPDRGYTVMREDGMKLGGWYRPDGNGTVAHKAAKFRDREDPFLDPDWQSACGLWFEGLAMKATHRNHCEKCDTTEVSGDDEDF